MAYYGKGKYLIKLLVRKSKVYSFFISSFMRPGGMSLFLEKKTNKNS
jgi:hypothetical protein